eukprot:559611-Prymnesium_polylepis.1
MSSQSAPTDPSSDANLNRSTAQGDAAAHGTAVLHSLGGLELAAVAASSTAVPVELRFVLLYDVRTALILYRNEKTQIQGATTSS